MDRLFPGGFSLSTDSKLAFRSILISWKWLVFLKYELFVDPPEKKKNNINCCILSIA